VASSGKAKSMNSGIKILKFMIANLASLAF
jgi:hypothetical protein